MTRKKSLIALGVSCTLGASAAALAASTPYPTSIDDATPWTSHQQRISSMITWDTHASYNTGSTSMSAGGSVGGTVSSLSGDEMQLSSATADEGTLALADEGIDAVALADEGIYSDFYRVSLVPVIVEQWDYYVISPTSASEDLYVLRSAASDEDFYILSSAGSDEDLYVLSSADEDFYVFSPASFSVVTLSPSYSLGDDEATFAM